MLNAMLWKLFRSSWRKPPEGRAPGYTALLAVPGDLPVFLKIAMGTLNAQDPAGLVETLVIPDLLTPAFEEAFAAAKREWSNGLIRLVRLRPPESWVTRRINSPHTNHWLQLVNGLEASRSTHALLHDADLFITDRRFLAAHYSAMAGKHLDCLGINPVWDPWYAANGFPHVTATWELMMRVDWARSFKPWLHRGHQGEVAGKAHEFDTTLLPQCLTLPTRIARHGGAGGANWGFVHFNYVICTYRWFRDAVRARKVYEDEHFRILLIRLLADAYGSGEDESVLPEMPEIERGLSEHPGRVSYRSDAAKNNYPEFRGKLAMLVESGVLRPKQGAILSDGVRRFDHHFAYDRTPDRMAVPREEGHTL